MFAGATLAVARRARGGYKCAMSGTRKFVCWSTLGVAVLMALAAIAAVYGYRAQWWTLYRAFTIVSVGLGIGIVTAVVALLALVSPPYGRPFVPRLAALAAIVVVAATALPAAIEQRTPIAASRVFDISSDVGNPPVFFDIIKVRGQVTTTPDYEGFEFAQAQQKFYPDIKPARLAMNADQAFVKALALAKNMGWQIVAEVPDQGRIEAIATTRWFKLEDDVVIRVSRIDANNARVDIRSKSRYARNENFFAAFWLNPRGDRGENARRVKAYLDRIGA